MQAPLLYSFRRCPYAIRARLALLQSGVAYELHEVMLRDKPQSLLTVSPKGTVPVMVLPDGRVLEQSLDIMHWALTQHDPAGWLTQAPAPMMQRLIDVNDLHFKPLLDCYKYPERHPQASAQTWRDRAIDTMLRDLDTRLRASDCLLGATPSLADMAILPFVRQFAQVDRPWWDGCELAALRQWLQTLTGTALFAAVMTKAG